MEQNQTYILILRDSLVNKKRILNNLIELTEHQIDIVKTGKPEIEEFDNIMDAKDRQIEMLNMLDDGFQNVYNNVKTELLLEPARFKELLKEIQQLISESIELGTRLESLELSNKEYIESFISKKKLEIKEFKASNNTAANYYKNMMNQHTTEKSYFMDKKK